MGIATIAETLVDAQLNAFVSSKSAAISGLLVPIALTAITIYVIIIGYAVMRGESHDPLHTVLWKFFKISFIVGIALTAGQYQALVIGGINGLQSAITSTFGAASLGGVIDNVTVPYESLGNALWSEATTGVFPHFALLAAAGFVAMAQFFIVVVALGMYLMAKISLALVLAIGPIFIFCAIFPATQRFTEQWLGQALQFVFINVLLAAAISMLFSIAQIFAQQVQDNLGATQVIGDTLSLLTISAGLCVVVLNFQSIASALSGGVGLQGLGREIARALMPGKKNSDPKPPQSGGSISENGNTSNTENTNQSLYRRHTLENIKRNSA